TRPPASGTERPALPPSHERPEPSETDVRAEPPVPPCGRAAAGVRHVTAPQGEVARRGRVGERCPTPRSAPGYLGTKRARLVPMLATGRPPAGRVPRRPRPSPLVRADLCCDLRPHPGLPGTLGRTPGLDLGLDPPRRNRPGRRNRPRRNRPRPNRPR